MLYFNNNHHLKNKRYTHGANVTQPFANEQNAKQVFYKRLADVCKRSQFVSIDGIHSRLSHVSCGVPQGSVLGPKLFILYVNDICNVSNLVKCILFADDTSLFCSDANINRMFERVSSVLASMCRWFAINKLSLNVLKTSYMLFRNNTAIDTELSINGVCLERVRVAKFLGVLIDEHLNWKPHIARVQSKLSKTTAILYKCSQIIDSCSMRILYCSIFLPYIHYCSEIWGNTYHSNINRIIIIQKRAIRLLFCAGRLDHTTPLFQRANILKFTDLVKLKTAVFMYKAYHCMLPENIQRNFVKKDIMHQTRTKQQLVRLCVSSNVRSMSLCVYGITLWNALRTDIKSKNSVNAFKQSYKKYIISEYE